jgi:hypothetical protein
MFSVTVTGMDVKPAGMDVTRAGMDVKPAGVDATTAGAAMTDHQRRCGW